MELHSGICRQSSMKQELTWHQIEKGKIQTSVWHIFCHWYYRKRSSYLFDQQQYFVYST